MTYKQFKQEQKLEEKIFLLNSIKTKGNKRAAARALKINPSTLHTRLEILGER